MKKVSNLVLGLLVTLALTSCSETSISPGSEASVLPVQIIGHSLVFRDEGPSTDFSALVRNPNSDLSLEVSEITVVALDAFDAVVGKATLSVFFLAPGAENVVDFRFYADVRDVEISVDKNPSVSAVPNPAVVPDSALSDLRMSHYDSGYNYAYVGTSVQIPADIEYPEVQQCAAVFSESGVFLAGNCELHEVIPGRKNGIENIVQIPPGTVPATSKRFLSF